MKTEKQEINIVITALGAISSLGLNAVQSCAAIRAGIAGFKEWEEYYCEPADPSVDNLEPLICARIPLGGLSQDEVTDLAIIALKEVIETAGFSRNMPARTGLFLCLPPDQRGEQNTGRSQRILPELYTQTGLEPFRETAILTSGHAGALMAMQTAAARLASGQVEYALVVGADSYLDPNILDWLDEAGRLKSEKNQDGFIPGQGAAAVLLETHPHAVGRNALILAAIAGYGQAQEEKTIDSELPSIGRGLCEAIQACCPQKQDQALPFEWVVCDLNGESYRAREWGYSIVKLPDTLNEIKTLWHPADCVSPVL